MTVGIDVGTSPRLDWPVTKKSFPLRLTGQIFARTVEGMNFPGDCWVFPGVPSVGKGLKTPPLLSMHLSRITGRTRPEAGGISVLFDARNEPRVEKLSDPLKRLSLMVVGWERRISGQALPPLR